MVRMFDQPKLFPTTTHPEDDEYELSAIRDIRQNKGKLEYLVEWKAYSEKEN